MINRRVSVFLLSVGGMGCGAISGSMIRCGCYLFFGFGSIFLKNSGLVDDIYESFTKKHLFPNKPFTCGASSSLEGQKGFPKNNKVVETSKKGKL
jgi:hypothetical protein